jgi:hypothetical protein
MTDQPDSSAQAPPSHSFRVTHVTVAGDITGGRSETSTGLLCASDAVEHITALAAVAGIPMTQDVDPETGAAHDAGALPPPVVVLPPPAPAPEAQQDAAGVDPTSWADGAPEGGEGDASTG